MQTVCFVSDLHKFAARSDADAVEPELRRVVARSDRCVLGGDIFDFRWSTLANRQATADAALDWLDRLLADAPETEVRYLLGNHDHVTPLVDALPKFCRLRPRMHWHMYYLRVGPAVFLHGDVADRPLHQSRLSREQFERRRGRSLHHGRRRRGRLSNAAYAALLQTRTQHVVPRVVYPTAATAGRILSYLDQVGQRDGVQEVFFGHTHRAVDGFERDGVRFHNAGAPIGREPLIILQTEVPDDAAIAAA